MSASRPASFGVGSPIDRRGSADSKRFQAYTTGDPACSIIRHMRRANWRRGLLAFATITACRHVAPRQLSAPPADFPSLPRYVLDVRMDPDRKRVTVHGTVAVPALFQSSNGGVRLVLDRMMTGLRVSVVQSAGAVPTRLDSVGFSGRDVQWLVHLSKPPSAGVPIVLEFSYVGGDDAPAPLCYFGGAVVYASGWGTNWYPGLGDGATRAVGTLRVQSPKSHPTVISGGARLVGVDTATGRHEFDVYVPTYLSFLAGRFIETREPGEIPVTVYTSELRPRAREQARIAAQAMSVLQREFGPYRMRDLAVVEYPDTLARRLGFNAAGEPGLLVLKGGFLGAPPSIANYGHELGHNWWPIVTGFVGPGVFMAEAMANYAAFRVVEALAGGEAGERFRRSGDPGFNWDISARFYLTNAAAGFDTALIAIREGTFPQRNMGGTKGAFVFDMLAAEVGRDRFRRALADVLERHAWAKITVEDLVREVGVASGRDLSWFYEQWFTRTGVPDFALTWRREGDRLHGVITQTAPYYRVSLPVLLSSADSGSAAMIVVVSGPRTEFLLTPRFDPARVEIDPRYRILRWTPEYRSAVEALAPVTRAAVHRSLDEFRAALGRIPRPDIHAFEFAAHLGMGQLFMDGSQSDSARVHLRSSLTTPTRDPEQLSLAYALLAVLAKKENDRVTLRWAVESAIATDLAAGIAGASAWARGLLDSTAVRP